MGMNLFAEFETAQAMGQPKRCISGMSAAAQERTKDNSKLNESNSISDHSCFKVPKSIVKSGRNENPAPGLSGKYIGMIQQKQHQLRKYASALSPQRFQTPQFGHDTSSMSSSSYQARPQKKYVRGPYKKKREHKFDAKLLEKGGLEIDFSS